MPIIDWLKLLEGVMMINRDELCVSGYKEYRENCHGGACKLFQKRFFDDSGTKYFLNINYYDFSDMKESLEMYSGDMQFNRGEETFNILIFIRDHHKIQDIEDLCEEFWTKMNMDYYEKGY